jgi:hypothetical protein
VYIFSHLIHGNRGLGVEDTVVQWISAGIEVLLHQSRLSLALGLLQPSR